MVKKPVTKRLTIWENARKRAGELMRGPIAQASMKSLGIKVAGLGLSFLQAILTARLLGPTGYGLAASILSVVHILATLAAFGMGPLAVREVPRLNTYETRPALSSLLSQVAIFVTCFATVLAALAYWLVLPEVTKGMVSSRTLLVCALMIPLLAALPMVGGWWRGFGKVVLAQIPNEIVRPAIIVTGLTAVLLFGNQLDVGTYFVIALSAVTIAFSLSFSGLWHNTLRRLPPRQIARPLRKTLADASPFLGLALTAILQGEVLTILLAFLAGPYETGLFQPVARLAPLMVLPVQAAGMRYAPRMAELHRENDMARIASITRTFTITTSLITVIFGLIIAASGPWLLLAFGREFVVSAQLLWILAAVQVFNAGCGPVGMLLTMTGHGMAALSGQIFGIVAMVGAASLLMPAQGALGAAYAMTTGIIAKNIWQLMLVRGRLNLNPSLLAFSRS